MNIKQAFGAYNEYKTYYYLNDTQKGLENEYNRKTEEYLNTKEALRLEYLKRKTEKKNITYNNITEDELEIDTPIMDEDDYIIIDDEDLREYMNY